MVQLMTNNLSQGGEQNPNRVNIHEDLAVLLWTDKFGCTKQQLEQAVQKVGSASGAVRAELGRRVPLRPLWREPGPVRAFPFE
jgi:hypothetical protein